MGAFDSSSDIPNQIKIEGETITVKFAPGNPGAGQGTVSWNIPTPALGCNSETDGAYCGIVVLLSTSPLTPDNIPQDGTYYVGDPIADADVHAGDTINGALVIGSFYEGDLKALGQTLTTEFVIQGLQKNTSYFVAGYASDCQARYHSDGQRAYSADYGNAVAPGTPASQTVLLGPIDAQNTQQGVLPTDGTGLIPGMPYEFELAINPNFPDANANKRILVSGTGEDFPTYQHILDETNKAILMADNPPQSPNPLNQGRYYWDGEGLSQWDGDSHEPMETLIEPTDPATVASGDYWYNPDTDLLQRYDIPNPTVWNSINTITYHKDPTSLFGGGDYWFDGTDAYSWCATTWCQETLYNQTDNPAEAPTPTCGSYWFDEVNEVLYNWNTETQSWEEAFAITWDVAPNNLLIGTYWYDETNNIVNQWDGAVWNDAGATVSNEAPLTPADMDLWYNPDSEELKQWVDATSEWVDLTVLVWPEDPTNTESCDLWWRTSDNVLHKWDSVNAEWDAVYEFTISDTDPAAAPVIEVDSLWYNPSNMEMKRWDGTNWVDVTYMNFPTQPNLPATGDAWHDTANSKWYVWDTPGAGIWNEVNPIDSEDDPLTLPNGTFWFDTTGNALYERQGATWVSVPYSTQPFYPEFGDLWFDSINDILMEWKRLTDDPSSKEGQWVEATPLATAEFDDDGHIIISTTGTGSDKLIMILLPQEVPYTTGGFIATGTAGKDCCFHQPPFADVEVLSTDVPVGTFLFEYLVPKGTVMQSEYGNDGVHHLPSYERLGVGDDGTPDERRQIMDWVRSQLGYPVVQVELTQKHIDEAVDVALETIRQRTTVAYERCFTFMQTTPYQQDYLMTNRRHGYDRIVTITSAHRFTSAFLSSAHGSGVYGQIVLQHLYNMGTFDLLSYHLVSEYIEQMEHLFATRLVYTWHEHSRKLKFHQAFTTAETILLDVTAEKREQDIIKDRWARPWIRRFALMKGMEVLAQIRGKYATLPGAGGGVSLNAADLIVKATEIREELNSEIEDFISDTPEDQGMFGTFVLG